MESINDKVILVTGGGRGLGAAACMNLAEAGADVQVADVRYEMAEAVASNIVSKGGRATAHRLDVTDTGQIESCMDKVMARGKRLDAVINNAGIDKTVSIEQLSSEDWNRILAVNLTGPFLVSKQAMPILREQGGGHIVNIVSTAAKRCWPNAAAYHASKWGLLGFSHALHAEARPQNIKVTAMICGGMRTPFLLDRFPEIDVNNLQDPADVAATIRYILSAPKGTVIPEIMALPMRETSWP